MKPFTLIARKETEKLPPSLVVLDFKKDVVCTIWAAARITPSEQQQDYDLEEIIYFVKLSENFFTFYNNLLSKDEEIKRLNELLNANPILERQ